MSSIVIIATFEDLAAVAEETCAKLGEPISVIRADLKEAVSKALEAEKQGAEIIISRGTAAWMMMQSDIRVPIVEIPITGYDLIKAFMEARKWGTKIGIADTPEILRGVETIESIYECRLEKYPIHSLDDVEHALNHLIRKGIDVLIGKYVFVQKLHQSRINAVTLTSGSESVIQAVHEAKKILQVRRSEMARTKQFQAILDYIRDGVLAVDEKGTVTVCNPAVEKILHLSRDHLLGENIADVWAQSRISQVLESGVEEINRIQEVRGVKIITNRIPIRQGERVIGLVSTFQEVSKLQQQEQEIRKKLSYRGHVTKYGLHDVVGKSPSFLQVLQKAQKYAAVDSTVLLYGETGVGKEVFAHLIHNLSSRTEGPFVAVNCAAIPDHLLESELFGYVEGAFTGAKKGGKTGLFELAHGGTIFLDEIGELTEALQVRLLRVLQEGEVMRLGDERVIPINVRVVTATNRNLEERVSEGKFRADLFYRINILQISVPSLRERREDIPLLCEHFLKELQKSMPKPIKGFEASALDLLKQYDWPGNIRQLRNMIERAVILSMDDWITCETLWEAGGKAFEGMRLKDQSHFSEESPAEGGPLRDYEMEHILDVLQKVGGNRSEAAKILGIGRSTLWRKLKNQ